ncbi:MAG: hypothetical protein KJ709_06935 [Nanoarchaeota archaeon]|nr:hypothetical protein [Nanoarchaeota archaeon]
MVEAELLQKYGFEEERVETASARKGPHVYSTTGYPRAAHRYWLIFEAYNQSIEEMYYWQLEWCKFNQGYAHQDIEKITDIFAASEQSSFFGSAQQRLGLQQDKVSQFLATVGKMVKELFQLVRELRIIDERLAYYRDSYKGSESAEITLKGICIDLVEQGGKNPASVYGMARELQFITLPDLFFSIHPKKPEDVDPMVDRLDFNRKVKEVLKRKLRTYVQWKKETYRELGVKRRFTLKFMRQHYDVIHMYMSWVRPYLRNIKRMHMADKTKSPDMINAFEGSMVELEFLAKKLPQKFSQDLTPKINELVYSVVLATFLYRTRPSMNYQQEGYQRGPLHVGKTEMTLRGYAWTQEEIDKYKKMREEEDFELMGQIDGSLKAAMEALGDELENYLKEAGDSLHETTKGPEIPVKKDKPSGFLDPFASIFRGVGELTGSFLGNKPVEGKKVDKFKVEQERKTAVYEVMGNIWYMYKDYKKTHGMLTW